MRRALFLVVAASVLAAPSRAQQPVATQQTPTTEIFKCKGADGHWTYTNDRREAEKQKCEVVTRQVNVAPAPPPQRASTPAARGGFPKESASDRASARERQREILEQELAGEQAALAKAKQDLAAQEAVRSGSERNYARVEERLQPYKDTVETHEKNIEALRRELNNLYR
jgi:flagellar biosynthesis/type III secretory pathway protein FliH